MEVSIKGGTKSQKAYAKSIIEFCADKLMSTRLANTLTVKLHFTPLYEKHRQMGNCSWEDDSYRPKEFTIEIDPSARLRRVLESICHEMVHVKQFAKGEMRDLASAERVSWNGQKYDISSDEYFERPWEIEAHGRELGLFIRWAEKHELGHLKWTHDK